MLRFVIELRWSSPRWSMPATSPVEEMPRTSSPPSTLLLANAETVLTTSSLTPSRRFRETGALRPDGQLPCGRSAAPQTRRLWDESRSSTPIAGRRTLGVAMVVTSRFPFPSTCRLTVRFPCGGRGYSIVAQYGPAPAVSAAQEARSPGQHLVSGEIPGVGHVENLVAAPLDQTALQQLVERHFVPRLTPVVVGGELVHAADEETEPMSWRTK